MKQRLQLEAHHRSRLQAAIGWLELGNPIEAHNELEHLPAKLRAHPEVLNVRCEIYMRAKSWSGALTIAESLAATIPGKVQHWVRRSFVLHEMKRTQEAYDLLLPASEKFPKDWLVKYNLACYLAQLGRNDEAKPMIQQAFTLGDAKQIKAMALDDPDLAPLWE